MNVLRFFHEDGTLPPPIGPTTTFRQLFLSRHDRVLPNTSLVDTLPYGSARRAWVWVKHFTLEGSGVRWWPIRNQRFYIFPACTLLDVWLGQGAVPRRAAGTSGERGLCPAENC